MYMVSMMTYSFSVRGFGHPVFLKPYFGHPVMKILAKTLLPALGIGWGLRVINGAYCLVGNDNQLQLFP